jgi:hypothetical protein
MKYFLIISLAFLFFCFLFGYFYKGIPAKDYIANVEGQENPFSVAKDSAKIIWTRADEYLEKNKLFIVGGNLQREDSLLYIPYYNDFHKGNSVRIQMFYKKDLVVFKIESWYSGKDNIYGAKKIAYYMRTGRSH